MKFGVGSKVLCPRAGGHECGQTTGRAPSISSPVGFLGPLGALPKETTPCPPLGCVGRTSGRLWTFTPLPFLLVLPKAVSAHVHRPSEAEFRGFTNSIQAPFELGKIKVVTPTSWVVMLTSRD